MGPFVASLMFCYVVVAATAGVPQAADVRYVELGGKYVTRVAGPVPNVAAAGAVPPEKVSPSALNHVVVRSSVVPAFPVLACIWI